jgi:hypothetical protein
MSSMHDKRAARDEEIAISQHAPSHDEKGERQSILNVTDQTEVKSDPNAVTGLPLALLFIAVVLATLQMALNATVLGTVRFSRLCWKQQFLHVELNPA